MDITFKLENFQGPLNLLYHMIEKDKIDIYDIPISKIADQYFEIIQDAQKRNMEVMSEFLVMAATLLELKSRMLLPKEKNEEEEIDPRLELVEKLIEYKKFKNITDDFREREEKAALNIFKDADPSLHIFKEGPQADIDDFLEGISFEHIYNAFAEVMKRKERKIDRVRSSFKAVERDLYTVEEKAEYIKDLLVLSPKITFWEIFRKDTRKAEVVVTFIALLELIKTKVVNIEQEDTFSKIFITKYNGSDKEEI